MGYIDGAIRSGERAEQEVLAVHQSEAKRKPF
jgi:monoamine oxidase